MITSELSKEATDELLGYRGRDFTIVVLEKGDIETLLKNHLPLNDLLMVKIKDAALR
jgi:hypothetical protein